MTALLQKSPVPVQVAGEPPRRRAVPLTAAAVAVSLVWIKEILALGSDDQAIATTVVECTLVAVAMCALLVPWWLADRIDRFPGAFAAGWTAVALAGASATTLAMGVDAVSDANGDSWAGLGHGIVALLLVGLSVVLFVSTALVTTMCLVVRGWRNRRDAQGSRTRWS